MCNHSYTALIRQIICLSACFFFFFISLISSSPSSSSWVMKWTFCLQKWTFPQCEALKLHIASLGCSPLLVHLFNCSKLFSFRDAAIVQSFSGCVLGRWISPFVCETGSQRNSYHTAVVFSVQGVLCIVCLWVHSIWETWPRQLAWHAQSLQQEVAHHLSPSLGLWLWYAGS